LGSTGADALAEKVGEANDRNIATIIEVILT
jgi:hypothetical protein